MNHKNKETESAYPVTPLADVLRATVRSLNEVIEKKSDRLSETKNGSLQIQMAQLGIAALVLADYEEEGKEINGRRLEKTLEELCMTLSGTDIPSIQSTITQSISNIQSVINEIREDGINLSTGKWFSDEGYYEDLVTEDLSY